MCYFRNFMLDQFTQEYKQIMLDAENRAKQFGFKNILPEDILLQIAKLSSGNIAELFTNFGINEALLLDIFSRPPFLSEDSRIGDYVGISDRMRDLIVTSLKIAANFNKKQAGIEDFILSLFQTPSENWFAELLDFVGISPKLLEQEIIAINQMISRGNGKNMGANAANDGIFGPIDEIMNMIEDHFGPPNESPIPGGNPNSPFAANPPQEKRDSKTPALDFF